MMNVGHQIISVDSERELIPTAQVLLHTLLHSVLESAAMDGLRLYTLRMRGKCGNKTQDNKRKQTRKLGRRVYATTLWLRVAGPALDVFINRLA
jgi:hypothetical protein